LRLSKGVEEILKFGFRFLLVSECPIECALLLSPPFPPNGCENCLTQIGLKVNGEKSRILCDSVTSFALPRVDHTNEFVILGANVATSANACRQFESRLILKQEKYFHLLSTLRLHPQIMFTLLRICGAPRIQYHCSVTDPANSHMLTLEFDKTTRRLAEWLVDPSGETKLTIDQLHSTQGLGLPNYSLLRHELYGLSKAMALTDDPAAPVVVLTHSQPSSTLLSAQTDSQWLFYDPRLALTPAQFSAALAIRLNVLPKHIRLTGSKCNCGFHYDDDATRTIEHVLKCDMATPITHTVRHNMVRDAFIDSCRAYGITTTKEPACFAYQNGQKQRPDALLHTSPNGLTTDFTLIASDASLEDAEKEKTKRHASASAAHQCIFTPFCMHTRGTIGNKQKISFDLFAKVSSPTSRKTSTGSYTIRCRSPRLVAERLL
jgi:hypothetical protein